ncbi:MAG TPA: hypothetical protein PK691_08865, partial [Thermomicrobiales bacterium]|nr:hypothetical protein [Thermomicrobiales bacterium]
VSRQVRERINQPHTFWDRIGLGAGGRTAVTSLLGSAALLVILVGGYMLLGDRLGSGNGDPTVIAGAQTTEVAQQLDTATASAPTATVVAGVIKTPEDDQATIPNIRDVPATETAIPATATERSVQVADDQTATETATEAPPPTETETVAPQPTKTATDVPVDTETATLEPKPTKTATVEPEPTEKPRPTKEPTGKPKPTKAPTDVPTATNEPAATETAVVEPTETAVDVVEAQPTIAPSDNETPVVDETDQAPTDVATEESVATDTVEAQPTAEATDDSGAIIEPITTPEQSDEPTEEATEDTGIGGGTEETTPDASETTDTQPASLDSSELLTTTSGSGGAPIGPLWINNDALNLTVLSEDQSGGLLQVVSMGDGNVLYSLGAAEFPIWSPQGLVLLYQDQNAGIPQAAIYDSELGTTTPISLTSDETYATEIPIGWNGASAYYLRLLGDEQQTGVIYGYDVNSLETSELWRGTNVMIAGGRPVAGNDGILLPTTKSWLRISWDGTETTLDSTTYAVTGAPILSPFESLIMYPTDAGLVVASVDAPGTALGPLIPFSPGVGAGYTWEPNGEYLAVSDGTAIHIYDYQGNSVGDVTSESGMTIAAPQWREHGIIFVETGPEASIRRIPTASIPGYQAP